MDPHDRERRPGLWRCLLMFLWLIGSLVLSLPPAAASIGAERELLKRRVDAVRGSLTPASGAGISDHETPGGGKLAQWMNWPNWRNWPNWPNWRNWGNWFNR